MLRSLTDSMRALRRRPLFAGLAVASIALGVGGTTFLASLYRQVVLRELPVPRPSELFLVTLRNLPVGAEAPADTDLGESTLRDADVEELARSVDGQAELAAWSNGTVVVSASGATDRVDACWVTPRFFETLRLQPTAGRLFDRRDATAAGGGAVAVLSRRSFERRFASRLAVIGSSIRVDGRPATIVGVAPATFRSIDVGEAPELFLLADEAPQRANFFNVTARLGPGSSPPAVEAALRTGLEAIRARNPGNRSFSIVGNETVEVQPRIELAPGARGRSALRGTFSQTVLLVGAMFVVVVVVLAGNLANLLAARVVEDRRATAIRLALGAGRRRIAAGLLLEAVLLAAAGTALGLFLAGAAAPPLLRLLPVTGLDVAFDFRPDGGSIAVGALLALAASGLIGAFAAREATRGTGAAAFTALRSEGSTSTTGRARVRWRWTLVGGQVALSVILLAGMGLLVRTLGALLAIDTRMPLSQVLSFRLELPDAGDEGSAPELADLRTALTGIPGVDSAAYSLHPALARIRGFVMVSIEGYQPASSEALFVPTEAVSPGFFETLGFPIVRGRSYRDGDAEGEPNVVVVNQRFVERYLGGREPLGSRISFSSGRAGWEERRPGDLEVVGVVADGLLSGVREQPEPRIFPLVHDRTRAVSYFVRAADPLRLAPAVRELVRSRLPGAALVELGTLARQRDRLLAEPRFLGALSSGFGLFTTLLAALGLYGVLSYVARGRQRELALRMALGARGDEIARLVAWDAGRALVGGLAAGLAVALPATRLLRSFLYGVEPGDPVSLAGAVAVLVAVCAVAAGLPARRAAKIDPSTALRSE